MRLSLRWCALVLTVLAPAAHALDPAKAITQYPQTAWRTDDGLPQNNVHAIAGDASGYTWLGTESGLARFDGVRFVPFLSTNTPGIANNSIWTLLSDRRGDLWVGTEGGLTRRHQGQFQTYTTKDGLPNNVVHALFQDDRGTVWVGTAAGLARFDGGRLATVDTPGAPGRDERVRAFEQTHDGTLWMGTERGLFRRAGDTWSKLTTHDGLGSDNIYAIHEDAAKRLWIATYGGGVTLREGDRFRTFTTADGLAHLFVYAIHEDRDGVLWFGTDGGLSRWYGGRFETMPPKEGLGQDRIWTFYEDAEGSLWLGLRGGGGLVRLKDGAFVTYGPPEGMLGANIYGAHEDRDGNIWAAMLGTGVARIGRDGTVRNFDQRDGLLGHNRIWTVCVTREGRVWAGGDQGLFQLVGDRFVPVPGFEKVRGLLQSRTGTLWVGTVGAGLIALDGPARRTIKTADGLPSDSPTALYEAKDGTLWAGTWGGGIAQLQDGKVVHTYTTKDGLASDSVKVITQDRDGAYWFGTTGGLTRLQDGKLATFSMKDGLHDDVIFQIFEDEAGFLWMGSTRGVFRVSRRELAERASGKIDKVSAMVYGTGDGLRVGACTGLGTPAGFRSADGRFWFTTPKGLSAVNPAQRSTTTWKPPLVVEEILADDAPVPVTDGVKLSGGVREIEIRYTALSFRAPERVRFKVWLEGFDKSWRDVGTRREVYYTNLPPREYRLKIVAASQDSSWADAEQVFAFRVEPLFYQTRWFAGIVIVGIAALIFGAHRWRVRQLQEREAVLARRVDEALSQLKLLSGMLPICASCKKIRDDSGYWNQIESYIHEHSQAEFSHSICPDCMVRLYPEYASAKTGTGGAS